MLRGIAIEDPMISFGDNEESLKTRIWLYIQIGDLDHHRNAHCTASDKGLYMSLVWWLNVMRFQRFAIPIVRPEKKKNNKDSTEIRKTIKDSDKIGIF